MKVTLTHPHTHAGQKYPAGATIDVHLLDALWLKSVDKIETGIDALKAEFAKLKGDAADAHKPALDKAVAADAARTPVAAPAVPPGTPPKG